MIKNKEFDPRENWKEVMKIKENKEFVEGNMRVDIYSMYAIYDKDSGMYDIPFFCKSDLFARRKFMMDIRSGGKSMLANFKDSFTLVRIGTFNPVGAIFELSEETILTGTEVEKS